MGVNFNAAQIQTMSSDLLLLPDQLNNEDTGLIAAKAKYAGAAQSMLATDGNQKVFSDAWIAAINAYHAELIQLSAEIRTAYPDARITEAAAGVKGAGTHYPTAPPPWTSLTPKIIDATNGAPVSTGTNKTEPQAISEIQALPALLTTGFNDGSQSYTATLAGNTLTFGSGTTPTGFASGQRLYLSGSSVFFATVVSFNPAVTTPTPAPANLTIAVTGGTASDGSVTVQNFFPGFSNAQRSGTASLGSYASAYASLRNGFKAAVLVWRGIVDAEATALGSNQDFIASAHVSAALANVNAALTAIDTWKVLPDLTVNGLLSDSGLQSISDAMTTRVAQVPARVTEIHNDLGSVAQNGDGSYSGSGAYLSLFKIVDLRASLGLGTLTKYYDNLRNQGLFDKQISNLQSQIDQYNAVMYVSKLLADSELGQDTFAVDSLAGLTVGASVLVMDNSSVTYARTVSLVTGSNVKLNAGIPLVLTVANLARIVKIK